MRASKLQLIDFYFGLQRLLIKELLPCQVQINSAILHLGGNASFQLARTSIQLFSISVGDHLNALGHACRVAEKRNWLGWRTIEPSFISRRLPLELRRFF